MKPMIAWLQNNIDTCWLNIEKSLCSLKSLQDLPFLDAPIKEMATWTKNTLKIWVKVQSTFGLPTQISPLTSIGSIKSFIPNNLDIGFRRWSEYGLVHLHQLFSFGSLRTFEQLRNCYGLPKTDFYRYLQLRTFLTRHKEWGKLTKISPIEQFLIETQTGNGDGKIMSKLYNIFLSLSTQNSLQIKQRWEAEMDVVISQEAWEEMCSEAHLGPYSQSILSYR